MIYKEFKGLKLSGLGFGVMRLPVTNGDDHSIDREKAIHLIDLSMNAGINYFDTGWLYHGGKSEIILGKALSKYPRESYYLADKFPGYDISFMDKIKRLFEIQLKKTGAGYFDFYLFHNVCEMDIDAYLDPRYGILDYLMEQKANGRIRHLGFSSHAQIDVLKRFLDEYGEYMEFCQLQINYLDWNFQHAKEKAALLNSLGIPIWIMEPLRGGKLAKLDPVYEKELKTLRPDEDIPAWAFRFLQSIPGVTMILSGMSDEAQLIDNLKTFKDERPLNAQEFETLMKIADHMQSQKTVPCTACHYCVRHCPMKLEIPSLISLYNEHIITTACRQIDFIVPMAIKAMPSEKRPPNCLHCKSCEQVCPQQINISEIMEEFSKLT